MLINVYVLSLVLAAILLVSALFFGDKRSDAGDEAGVRDKTRPSEIGQLAEVGRDNFAARTLRSRGFWTFFVSFFGMSGLVLDGLDLMSPTVAFITAVATGALTGAGASAALRIG
jgi:hypothetical protein